MKRVASPGLMHDTRYMIYKYFLPFCGLCFYFLDEIQFIFFSHRQNFHNIQWHYNSFLLTLSIFYNFSPQNTLALMDINNILFYQASHKCLSGIVRYSSIQMFLIIKHWGKPYEKVPITMLYVQLNAFIGNIIWYVWSSVLGRKCRKLKWVRKKRNLIGSHFP